MSFKNKVAIITGAGLGIGKAMAIALAERGATVVVNDIDSVLVKQAEKQAGDTAGIIWGYPGDASQPSVINKMVAETKEKFGCLDITIANAGLTLFGDFFSYAPEDFNKVMQLNLQGTFFLTQASANVMKKQSSGGKILLFSSVTGHQAHKNLAAYGMSKAAIEMLARNLVIDLSPYGININAIAPGATMTERTRAIENFEEEWGSVTPLGKTASTKNIVDAALFLVSEKADYITGQSLVVDGGWTSVSPNPEHG